MQTILANKFSKVPFFRQSEAMYDKFRIPVNRPPNCGRCGKAALFRVDFDACLTPTPGKVEIVPG
jgi:hypothetical protein